METNNKTDKRGRLEEQPYDYRITKDQKVLIRWNGCDIMTLSEKKATKLIVSLANQMNGKRSCCWPKQPVISSMGTSEAEEADKYEFIDHSICRENQFIKAVNR